MLRFDTTLRTADFRCFTYVCYWTSRHLKLVIWLVGMQSMHRPCTRKQRRGPQQDPACHRGPWRSHDYIQWRDGRWSSMDMSPDHPVWQRQAVLQGSVGGTSRKGSGGRQTEMEAAGCEIIGGAPATFWVKVQIDRSWLDVWKCSPWLYVW